MRERSARYEAADASDNARDLAARRVRTDFFPLFARRVMEIC